MCGVTLVAAEGDLEGFEDVGDTTADSGAVEVDLFVVACTFFGSVFPGNVPVEKVF